MAHLEPKLPQAVVITSYSIHYTKLYDPDGTLNEPHYLTFTGKTGTVVYTDAPISPFDDFPAPRADVVQLDNVPIVLTNPGIWEALGLPLTPLEDTLDFFSDPRITSYNVCYTKLLRS